MSRHQPDIPIHRPSGQVVPFNRNAPLPVVKNPPAMTMAILKATFTTPTNSPLRVELPAVKHHLRDIIYHACRGRYGVEILFDKSEEGAYTYVLVVCRSVVGESILKQCNGRYCNVGQTKKYSGYSSLVFQFTPYTLTLTEDDYDRMIWLIRDDENFNVAQENHIRSSSSYGQCVDQVQFMKLYAKYSDRAKPWW